jgi:hypothetical protein
MELAKMGQLGKVTANIAFIIPPIPGVVKKSSFTAMTGLRIMGHLNQQSPAMRFVQ